jgi:hypothetical protein
VQQIVIAPKNVPSIVPSNIHIYSSAATPKLPLNRARFLFPDALSGIREEEALHRVDEIT